MREEAAGKWPLDEISRKATLALLLYYNVVAPWSLTPAHSRLNSHPEDWYLGWWLLQNGAWRRCVASRFTEHFAAARAEWVYVPRDGAVNQRSPCVSYLATLPIPARRARGVVMQSHTFIHAAAALNHTGRLSFLIDALNRSTSVAFTNSRGYTPLEEAAYFGCAGTARLLINAGADVNRAGDTGSTPLHAVSKCLMNKMNGPGLLRPAGGCDHLHVAQLLLDNRARLDATTSRLSPRFTFSLLK